MEILKTDWGFWGVVIGAIALIVTIVIYFLQRNVKRFAYRILTETSLVSVGRKVRGKIKVFYDDKEIENLYLVVLEIINNGNFEIRTSDFEEQPITINFPKSNLVSVEVSKTSPKSLKPAISYEPTQVTIQPLLLNKKDSFTLELIFSKYGQMAEFNARIVGIKDIEDLSSLKEVEVSSANSNLIEIKKIVQSLVLFIAIIVACVLFFLVSWLQGVAP